MICKMKIQTSMSVVTDTETFLKCLNLNFNLDLHSLLTKRTLTTLLPHSENFVLWSLCHLAALPLVEYL